MNYFSIFLLIIPMMWGCRYGTILNPEKRKTILSENELPENIIVTFRNLSEKENIWFDHYTFNLDSNDIYLSDKALETSTWSNGHQFIIGKKTISYEI